MHPIYETWEVVIFGLGLGSLDVISSPNNPFCFKCLLEIKKQLHHHIKKDLLACKIYIRLKLKQ